MIKFFIRTLWVLLLLGLFAGFMLFYSINKGWVGYMPPLEDLENPDYKFATQVFSADGEVLGTYSYSKDNRIYVGYDELSPHLINALIATEDVRFASHSGIDFKALMRAIVKRGILLQPEAGGGSSYGMSCPSWILTPRVGGMYIL